MGWKEKIKGAFIEDAETDISSTPRSVDEILNQQSITETKVEAVPMVVDNVIPADAIYDANNLTDKTKSIFMVDQIKSVLPANLPKEALKSSVLGMMEVSKVSVAEVLDDAKNRIDVLQSVLGMFTQETNEIVQNSENEISQLENRVNELKTIILNRKKDQENQEKIVEDESTKIQTIVDFIK